MPRKLPYFDNWKSFEIEPNARCNVLCEKNGKLQSQSDPTVRTVWDLFLRGLGVKRNRECLGWRNGNKFDFISYVETHERILQVAKALRQKLGLARGSFVGLYSVNSPQWMISAMACASSSFVLVPLYDTLGADSCNFIIREVEMTVLLVDNFTAASRILDNLNRISADSNNGCNNINAALKTIVLIGDIGNFDDDIDPAPADLHNEAARQFGIKIVTMNELTANDVVDDTADDFLPKPDDFYMVQYTSGTTGCPKGVILTHGNFVADEASIQSMYGNASSRLPNEEELCLHYLPLAHAYGQLLAVTLFYYGSACAFFSGNVQKLAEDAQILKPTYMPLVPRLMNKVYSKVTAEVKAKGVLASKLFAFAYERKREMYRRGITTTSCIWDKLVFRKLQAKLGGHCRFMLTASAPVAPEVLEFWRVVFGAHIFEAYGQTECTALVSVAVNPNGGNVGHPVACNKIKLADIPEMDLLASSGRGEVCVKGPNVMKGYFKRPDMTAEVIDADGWLHTGDIGEFTADGSLRLVDRKKHIFKLAQGEYIAPEKIESVYACCPLVAQVFVDGNGLQWFTVAVIVPDRVEAEQWAVKNGMGENADFAAICANKRFICYVLETLIALGRSKGLNQLEQVRNSYLHPELFSIENGLLTPSLKNRRPQLHAYFKPQVDKLYRDGPLEGSQ